MKRMFCHVLFSMLLAIMGCGLAFAETTPALTPMMTNGNANVPQLQPVNLKITLQTDKPSYRLGEPILVTPTLTNLTDSPLNILHGRSECYQLFDSTGQPLPTTVLNSAYNTLQDSYGEKHFLLDEVNGKPIADPHPQITTDIYHQQFDIFAPHEAFTESPVRLDTMYTITQPGTYTLCMQRPGSGAQCSNLMIITIK